MQRYTPRARCPTAWPPARAGRTAGTRCDGAPIAFLFIGFGSRSEPQVPPADDRFTQLAQMTSKLGSALVDSALPLHELVEWFRC